MSTGMTAIHTAPLLHTGQGYCRVCDIKVLDFSRRELRGVKSYFHNRRTLVEMAHDFLEYVLKPMLSCCYLKESCFRYLICFVEEDWTSVSGNASTAIRILTAAMKVATTQWLLLRADWCLAVHTAG